MRRDFVLKKNNNTFLPSKNQTEFVGLFLVIDSFRCGFTCFFLVFLKGNFPAATDQYQSANLNFYIIHSGCFGWRVFIFGILYGNCRITIAC